MLLNLESLQDEPKVYWIDAICINQQDDAEKSTQVQAMRDVYDQAKLVIAWLGPSEEYGEFVLGKLEIVGQHVLQSMQEEISKRDQTLRI